MVGKKTFETLHQQITRLQGTDKSAETKGSSSLPRGVSASSVSQSSDNRGMKWLSDLVAKIGGNKVLSGLYVEADDPASEYIYIRRKFDTEHLGIADGILHKIDEEERKLEVPLGKAGEIFINLYNGLITLDDAIFSNKVTIAKIIIPSDDTVAIQQDQDHEGLNGHIVDSRDLLFNNRYVVDDDTINAIRNIVENMLADNLQGTLTLTEQLKIVSSQESLELNSKEILIKYVTGAVAARFNQHGIFFFDEDGTETARFTEDDARIGNIRVTPTTLESFNYLSGVSGFQIQDNGDAEFNNLLVRGELVANVGDLEDYLKIDGTNQMNALLRLSGVRGLNGIIAQRSIPIIPHNVSGTYFYFATPFTGGNPNYPMLKISGTSATGPGTDEDPGLRWNEGTDKLQLSNDGTTWVDVVGTSPTQTLTNKTISASPSITLNLGATIDEFSIDGTLGGNSDTALPTEKAVKTYIDGAVAGGAFLKLDGTSTMVGNIALGGNHITSNGAIHLLPNSDADDYFKFETAANIPSIFGVGAYLRIGDAGTTGHGLAAEDDLMVSGKLEVDGLSFFDSTVTIDQDTDAISLNIDSDATTADVINIDAATTSGIVVDINAGAVTSGKVIDISADGLVDGTIMNMLCQSTSITSGKVFNSQITRLGSSLGDTVGSKNVFRTLSLETRTSGTTTFNYDLVEITRSESQTGAGGTLNSSGSVLKITSAGAQVAGTMTNNVMILEINQRSRHADDVYAIEITSINDGAGNPGGIDMSSFSVDEPLIKAVDDAVSSAGTLSKQIAVDIGGTTYYIYAYTTGS